MSSIADFRLIEVSKLGQLKLNASNNYFDYLKHNTKELENFNWSGQIYDSLLLYLEDNGIDLNNSEFKDLSEYLSEVTESMCVILTEKQKLDYLTKLDPSNYNLNELKNYYNDFYGASEGDEVGIAMMDGIGLLHKNIQYASKNEVIIFGVY